MAHKIPGIGTLRNLIFLIDMLAILLLSFHSGSFDRNVLFFGSLLTLIIFASNYLLLKISSGDHYIFLIISLLVSIGVITIYRISPKHAYFQIAWFVSGNAVFFAFYFIIKKIKDWQNWTLFYAALSFALFLSTLIFGTKIKGATNWIHIFNFSFQPAELIKILLVFFLASYYSKKDRIFGTLGLIAIIYAFILFLFLQRDLGTAMIFYFVFMVIFYIFEESRKWIGFNIAGAALLGAFAFFAVNHVHMRVIVWMNPWKFIDTGGYQITQSLFAIASGGFFGTGIGLGHPEYIPEVHTDFIFSAICEEMGIFGGIGVIFLFMILVYRGYKISLYQNDLFLKIAAIGISTLLGFQSFIIIGGSAGMIPLTGVTLPFVSYGGSSLIISFACLGILQAASEQSKQIEDCGEKSNG